MTALAPIWTLCSKYNSTHTQLALSYVLSYPEVSTVIPGIRTPAQAELNTAGLFALEAKDRQLIEDMGNQAGADGDETHPATRLIIFQTVPVFPEAFLRQVQGLVICVGEKSVGRPTAGNKGWPPNQPALKNGNAETLRHPDPVRPPDEQQVTKTQAVRYPGVKAAVVWKLPARKSEWRP